MEEETPSSNESILILALPSLLSNLRRARARAFSLPVTRVARACLPVIVIGSGWRCRRGGRRRARAKSFLDGAPRKLAIFLFWRENGGRKKKKSGRFAAQNTSILWILPS